jgi:hypothetical protein
MHVFTAAIEIDWSMLSLQNADFSISGFAAIILRVHGWDSARQFANDQWSIAESIGGIVWNRTNIY